MCKNVSYYAFLIAESVIKPCFEETNNAAKLVFLLSLFSNLWSFFLSSLFLNLVLAV